MRQYFDLNNDVTPSISKTTLQEINDDTRDM